MQDINVLPGQAKEQHKQNVDQMKGIGRGVAKQLGLTADAAQSILTMPRKRNIVFALIKKNSLIMPAHH